MAMDLEQVLLARAAQDAEKYPSDEAATYGGAALGALAGYSTLGEGLHQVGRNYERIANKVAPLPDGKLRKSPKYMPGGRMAGGLVGAILGGALGPTIRNAMVSESPAATLLAKAQAGTMTPSDAYALQKVLGETYSQMGIV